MRLIKVLSFICALCFAMVLIGFSGAWGQVHILSGSCTEKYCEICEKKITKWIEGSPFATYSTLSSIGGGGWCGPDGIREIRFSAYHFVCSECSEKYANNHWKAISDFEENLFNKIYLESESRRKVNRDKNKSEALKKLLEDAKGIEKRIKELDKEAK